MLIAITVIPGIYQFLSNFQQINYLFTNIYKYQNINFLVFFKQLSSVLIFRTSQNLSIFYLSLLIFLIVIINKKMEDRVLYQSIIIFMVSFVANMFLLFLFSNQFFTIFVERSFWFFYFTLIIIISIIFLLYLRRNKIISLSVLAIFIIFCLVNYLNPGNVSGEVSYEVKYNHLLEELTKEKKLIKNIIFVDKKHAFLPLTNYFFSDIYPSSAYYYKKIADFKKKGLFLTRIDTIQKLDKYCFSNEGKIIIVAFSPNKSEVKYLTSLYIKNRNLIIFYSKKINAYQWDFFRL